MKVEYLEVPNWWLLDMGVHGEKGLTGRTSAVARLQSMDSEIREAVVASIDS